MNSSKEELLGILSNRIKQPTTIEEQINILKSRNVIIEDEKFAKDFLKIFNYYFVTGYLHSYKQSNNCYHNAYFNKIACQIKFDMRLREIFIYCLEVIEKTLKTTIGYYFSHNYKYGNIAYSDSMFFPNNEGKHEKLIGYYNTLLKNNKDLPFVKHNLSKYEILPTWAAIELFTMGNLENFFEILNSDTLKGIEKTFKFPKNKISNWIKNLRIFRNMVAHNQRLYNFPIFSTPLKPKEYKEQTGRIFDYVIIMKFLFLDVDDWNGYVLPRLEYIFDDFVDEKNDIKLKCIGFPDNWKEVLKK